MSTNFKAVNDEDVINKGFLDENMLKIDGHLSVLENDYSEFILQYNEEAVEENLTLRAVKTTIQILYDKELFDKYTNADNVLEDFLFSKRRRVDLSEQVIDDIQCFCSKI